MFYTSTKKNTLRLFFALVKIDFFFWQLFLHFFFSIFFEFFHSKRVRNFIECVNVLIITQNILFFFLISEIFPPNITFYLIFSRPTFRDFRIKRTTQTDWKANKLFNAQAQKKNASTRERERVLNAEHSCFCYIWNYFFSQWMFWNIEYDNIIL